MVAKYCIFSVHKKHILRVTFNLTCLDFQVVLFKSLEFSLLAIIPTHLFLLREKNVVSQQILLSEVLRLHIFIILQIVLTDILIFLLFFFSFSLSFDLPQVYVAFGGLCIFFSFPWPFFLFSPWEDEKGDYEKN